MRKLVPVSIAAAAVLAVSGGVGYQVLDKTVELSVDGVPTTVTTLRGDVGQLLEQQGLEVGARDVVAPTLDTPLRDGDRVTVQYGREVTVDVDGAEVTHWTTATTVSEALAMLQIKAEGADVSTSRSSAIGRDGLAFSVDTLKQVELVVGGETETVQSTASTVGEVLESEEIELDDDDKVTPATDEALTDGATITVVDVEVKDVEKKTEVGFQTVRRNSDELLQGTTQVQTAGKPGERTVVTTETREDGEVVKEEQKSDEVTTQPVDEVVLVGTRAPAPAPRASTPSAPSSAPATKAPAPQAPAAKAPAAKAPAKKAPAPQAPAPQAPAPKAPKQEPASSSSDGVWDRLAQCESGGNWSINTGNGYYGGVQFSAGTWKAQGGQGLPHENSKAEQIRIAKKLQAAAGWGQWPHCSAKLGLR